MPDRPVRVLITGGSRGLGRAIAEHLAAEGVSVGLVARDAEALREATDTILDAGGTVFAASADVRDEAALESAVSRLADRLGGIDALVCAAGQLRGIGPMAVREPGDWWDDVEIALKGAHQAIRSSLPRLRESGRASISVLVGPGHEGPLPFASGYGCAQAALVRLVESLGQELRSEGVPVYAINPGLVPTGVVRGLIDTPEGRRWLPRFNEAFAEGKEVDSTFAAGMVAWLIDRRPVELNGRIVTALLNPAVLETRLNAIAEGDRHVLRLR